MVSISFSILTDTGNHRFAILRSPSCQAIRKTIGVRLIRSGNQFFLLISNLGLVALGPICSQLVNA